jgi:HAD superfamily hydrolase (TIGR01549 family)
LIEAVIFDLDGTLIKLPIDYEAMFAEFKKITKTQKIQPLLETVAKLDSKTKKQVFTLWDKFELEASGKVTPNAQGMHLYSEHSGKPNALVTMQGKAFVKTVLDRYGLRFDIVFTREDSVNRAEQLKCSMEKLKTSFQNVLFVGNTEGDALAAKETGCSFVRVK